jgi:Ca2+-binding RTX toxin-like protein
MDNKYFAQDNRPYFIDSLLTWTHEAERTVQANIDLPSTARKTITYNFATSPYQDHNAVEHGLPQNFRSFNSTEKNVVLSALKDFEQVLNVKFVASSEAQMTFFMDDLSNRYGADGSRYTGYGQTGGDVHFNSSRFNNTDLTLDGSLGVYTVLHETAHTLGLKHPHYEGPDGNDPWPTLISSEDHVSNTIMSYDRTGGESVLGDFDLAALQYIYGPSTQQRAGNSTYNVSNHYIWDGAGVDRIDLSGAWTNTTLNMSEGQWSHVGNKSSSILAAGQMFIGYGTKIENANGSKFNDTITGNDYDNTIYGMEGDDTLRGGAGNDYLSGGTGKDTLLGGSGNDVFIVDNYDDRVIEYSKQGNDTVYSTVSFRLPEYVENLHLNKGGIAIGNSWHNKLVGNAEDNQLYGLAGNDTLYGNAGDDALYGGRGKDVMSGGSGKDVFIFESPYDSSTKLGLSDVITDFKSGEDKISLSAIDANVNASGDQAFKLISASASFSQAGQIKFVDGVLYGNNDSDSAADFAIRLLNVDYLNYSDIIL